MQIIGMGLDYSTGAPLIDPIDEQKLARHLLESIGQNPKVVDNWARTSETALETRMSLLERQPSVDLNDPLSAGWTFLVNGKDPQLKDIIRTLGDLAEIRGMENPKDPLIFGDETPLEWGEWLSEYKNVRGPGKQSPHYILIVGGPDQVPFDFQSYLDVAASVGRVAFDSLEDLKTYVDKVVRLEEPTAPMVLEREAVFFATDHGVSLGGLGAPDVTMFSRRYLVQPLARGVRDLGFIVNLIEDDKATKEQLVESLHGARPALVFTASHGLGAREENLKTKKRLNGAIVCQRTGNESSLQDPAGLFTADDVPYDEPFLEGAIFFQFACYGYGTPAESDFLHWREKTRRHAEVDFVAALPKKLLAHPWGPVAFIGHVDVAKLYGFTELQDPLVEPHWEKRRKPFEDAVHTLLNMGWPVGRAMEAMNERHKDCDGVIASTWDSLQKKVIKLTPPVRQRLVEVFLLRNDAKNYMIFGDPAIGFGRQRSNA